MEVSADGAIRVAGNRAGDLLRVPAGAWEVVLVVGRADSLPSDPQIVLRATPRPVERSPVAAPRHPFSSVDGP